MANWHCQDLVFFFLVFQKKVSSAYHTLVLCLICNVHIAFVRGDESHKQGEILNSLFVLFIDQIRRNSNKGIGGVNI